MYYPAQDEFCRLAAQGNLIPVYREILADMETPVSAFRKIDDGINSFLLESIEGGEKWARYSFLGSGPGKIFRSRGSHFEVIEGNQVVRSGETADPITELKSFLAPYRPVQLPGLPRFFGGAVGYLGYDMVRFIEHLPDSNPPEIGAYDACFLLTEKLLIFDNCRQKIKAVCNIHLQPGEDPGEAWQRGTVEIDAMISRLRSPLPIPSASRPAAIWALTAEFHSREFPGGGGALPRNMFAPETSSRWFFRKDFPGHFLPIPSISIVPCERSTLRLTCFSCALAKPWSSAPLPRCWCARKGIRSRCGRSPAPGRGGLHLKRICASKAELLADPKERAEHIMLVDLGRNDLGRVCRTGSVEVSELMVIERYSHVMHIVSNVRGQLELGCDAFDVFRATFPGRDPERCAENPRHGDH